MGEEGPELGASQGRSIEGLHQDRYLGAEGLRGGRRGGRNMMATEDQGEIELQETAARRGDIRL